VASLQLASVARPGADVFSAGHLDQDPLPFCERVRDVLHLLRLPGIPETLTFFENALCQQREVSVPVPPPEVLQQCRQLRVSAQ